MKGRILLITTILLIATVVIIFLRTYDGKQGPLPSEDEIITKLN